MKSAPEFEPKYRAADYKAAATSLGKRCHKAPDGLYLRITAIWVLPPFEPEFPCFRWGYSSNILQDGTITFYDDDEYIHAYLQG